LLVEREREREREGEREGESEREREGERERNPKLVYPTVQAEQIGQCPQVAPPPR
jgi:hypothetical protein